VDLTAFNLVGPMTVTISVEISSGGCGGLTWIAKPELGGDGLAPFTYVFDASNVTYFRAPITGNPPESNLNYSISGGYRYIADMRFTDHEGVSWARVMGIVQNGVLVQDSAIQQAIAAGKGGLWVQHAVPSDEEQRLAYLRLSISETYTIPNIPWDGFSGVFDNWPLDPSLIYSEDTTLKEIHGLGYPQTPPSGASYPRNTHNGVDFFVPDVALPDDTPEIDIFSIGTGIVVGIGRAILESGNNNAEPADDSHGYWGASSQFFNGFLQPGFSIIIRYGHLYVLYGHLKELNDQIWVGGLVSPMQTLGKLGKFNDRHLHIELHSYGAKITDTIRNEFATSIGSTGILPVGESAVNLAAPLFYDLSQLLPNPSGYNPIQNNNLQFRERVNGASVTDISLIADLNFSNGETVTYFASDPAQNTVLESVLDNGVNYRGFVGYIDNFITRTFISPLVKTQEPS
jgi:hypothetical protein